MNFKKIWYLITLKLHRLKSRKATMTAVEDLNVTNVINSVLEARTNVIKWKNRILIKDLYQLYIT